VIKAAQMGIPFLVSRSGLTQMGFEIAEKIGITMIGRATNNRYLLFTGGERFTVSPKSAAGPPQGTRPPSGGGREAPTGGAR
ncbi:MAG: formate dehydrogenase accessory sulfurtransferase FdhD, partial [Betaproteobacteria bacterium]|nr:formate dehydrogenase accessory sulfurtransferase FdhD [Betaproteobacteria bacterium]